MLRKVFFVIVILALAVVAGADSLVAHWEFYEGSGSTASDSSGNGNTGTLYNMNDDDWVAGVLGTALDFDGSNDHIMVPDDSSMSFGTGPFSISFWIKQPVYNGGTILINGSSSSPSGKRYEIVSTSSYGGSTVGALVFVIDANDSDGGKRYTNSGTTFVSDDWLHCVCVHNTSTQKIYIYKMRLKFHTILRILSQRIKNSKVF